MTQPRDQLYQFASLSEYSLRQRITIRLADLGFFILIKVIGSTIRFEVQGAEHLEPIKAAGKQPVISFWHDRIFLGTYFWRDQGIVVMTSKSFDGEYIARFIQRFGYGAIRGSSSRRGAGALIEMIRSIRDGHAMAFAIDGPRGPRYIAKPGAVLLAQKTGDPIVPFMVQPRRCFRLKSWDKMQIPVPFTTALAIIGEPIYTNANGDADDTALTLKRLQDELERLNDLGNEWSEGGG